MRRLMKLVEWKRPQMYLYKYLMSAMSQLEGSEEAKYFKEYSAQLL